MIPKDILTGFINNTSNVTKADLEAAPVSPSNISVVSDIADVIRVEANPTVTGGHTESFIDIFPTSETPYGTYSYKVLNPSNASISLSGRTSTSDPYVSMPLSGNIDIADRSWEMILDYQSADQGDQFQFELRGPIYQTADVYTPSTIDLSGSEYQRFIDSEIIPTRNRYDYTQYNDAQSPYTSDFTPAHTLKTSDCGHCDALSISYQGNHLGWPAPPNRDDYPGVGNVLMSYNSDVIGSTGRYPDGGTPQLESNVFLSEYIRDVSSIGYGLGLSVFDNQIDLLGPDYVTNGVTVEGYFNFRAEIDYFDSNRRLINGTPASAPVTLPQPFNVFRVQVGDDISIRINAYQDITADVTQNIFTSNVYINAILHDTFNNQFKITSQGDTWHSDTNLANASNDFSNTQTSAHTVDTQVTPATNGSVNNLTEVFYNSGTNSHIALTATPSGSNMEFRLWCDGVCTTGTGYLFTLPLSDCEGDSGTFSVCSFASADENLDFVSDTRLASLITDVRITSGTKYTTTFTPAAPYAPQLPTGELVFPCLFNNALPLPTWAYHTSYELSNTYTMAGWVRIPEFVDLPRANVFPSVADAVCHTLFDVKYRVFESNYGDATIVNHNQSYVWKIEDPEYGASGAPLLYSDPKVTLYDGNTAVYSHDLTINSDNFFELVPEWLHVSLDVTTSAATWRLNGNVVYTKTLGTQKTQDDHRYLDTIDVYKCYPDVLIDDYPAYLASYPRGPIETAQVSVKDFRISNLNTSNLSLSDNIYTETANRSGVVNNIVFDKHSTTCMENIFHGNVLTGTQNVYLGSDTANVRVERSSFMTRSLQPVAPVPPRSSITYYSGYNSVWIPKFGTDSLGGYFAGYSFLPKSPCGPYCNPNEIKYNTYDVANLTQIAVNWKDRSTKRWALYASALVPGDEIILWGMGTTESDDYVTYYATYTITPDGFFYYGTKDVVITQFGNSVTKHGSYFYNVEFQSITTEPYTGYVPPEPWR